MNLRLSKNADKLEEIDLTALVRISLISFDKQLTTLNPKELLPRYNTLNLVVGNSTEEIIDNLLLTIFRGNSNIGAENYHIILIKTYGLSPKTTGEYQVRVFDWFNEKFDNIDVRLTTTQDWSKRKRIDDWTKKENIKTWIFESEKISKRIDCGMV